MLYVMQTKLTLRLDENIIAQAKKVAKDRGISVSKLVSDYFGSFALKEQNKPCELSPITNALLGVMENTELSEEDYKQHIEEKHL